MKYDFYRYSIVENDLFLLKMKYNLTPKSNLDDESRFLNAIVNITYKLMFYETNNPKHQLYNKILNVK